jgi:hypothetical protein
MMIESGMTPVRKRKRHETKSVLPNFQMVTFALGLQIARAINAYAQYACLLSLQMGCIN